MAKNGDTTTAKVLTGSTGSAFVDMPARTAWITFAGSLATIVCIIVGTETALTGAIVTAAGTGAILAAAVFDATLKDKL